MRSPAEARLIALARGPELLDHVDYRLAQTPVEKEEIYNLRYRAYLREGAVKESPDQRVTDQYDDLQNSWTFGVYLDGELSSSVRISVLTSEWRESCSAEAFGEILLISGSIAARSSSIRHALLRISPISPGERRNYPM